MTVERQLSTLERELKALKASYEQAATSIELTTISCLFSTSNNKITWDYGSGNVVYSYGRERIVVTLDAANREKTLAKLELTSDYEGVWGKIDIRRIPYDGGAKWIVSALPHTEVEDNETVWYTTTYQFVVQSMVGGTLSAKMIWE